MRPRKNRWVRWYRFGDYSRPRLSSSWKTIVCVYDEYGDLVAEHVDLHHSRRAASRWLRRILGIYSSVETTEWWAVPPGERYGTAVSGWCSPQHYCRRA